MRGANHLAAQHARLTARRGRGPDPGRNLAPVLAAAFHMLSNDEPYCDQPNTALYTASGQGAWGR